MKKKQSSMIILFFGVLIILILFLFIFQQSRNSKNIEEKCGIENCHGTDIECGPNIAELCTEIYMAGDNCRQYAECAVIEGVCSLEYSEDFESCKSCVERCYSEFGEDNIGLFDCESKCSE